MNLIKREWQSYAKATFFWSIGILALMMISFYKMQGLSALPGGVEAFLETMPSFLQLFFKNSLDMNTAIGIYGFIHLYMVIALSLHAALLGANIFKKEERDKTFEFLYMKGMKRSKILILKICAAFLILVVLDIVCVIGVYLASMMATIPLSFVELFPYIGALFLAQLLFFSLALLISLLPILHHKAQAISCSVILCMFFMTMYVKIGGQQVWLDTCSIFHYTDVDYIATHPFVDISSILIFLLALVGLFVSIYMHEHHDLLS